MEREFINVAQMGVNAQEFAAARVATNFTHMPLTAVDTKHADALAKLDTAVTNLGGKEAIQEGRGFNLKTTVKEGIRVVLDGQLKQANRTAAAIAEELGRPEIMDEFRMPHGHGEEQVKARALGMAAAIGDLGIDSDFAAHSLPNFAATLTATVQSLQNSAGEQGGALGEQVGATTAIPGYIKNLKSAVKTLDAIYHNVFAGDAETLGAWKSQSHIEKLPVKKKPPTPPV